MASGAGMTGGLTGGSCTCHHRRRVRKYPFHAYGVLGAARGVATHAWNLHEAYGGTSMPYSLVGT